MNPPKVHILHVDDDEANRYAVTRALRRAGFDVTEAASGTEALQKAETKPDLIILDVRLPDIDGFEVCRRIKRQPSTSQIPVLHLSASRVTSEDKAVGLDGGAEGYLVRPVEPVELVATINALLRARRSEAALQERDQQFRALIDCVREYVIFSADPGGRITSWPKGASRIVGYTESEAIGMACERLFTADDQASGLATHEMAVAAETGEYKSECVCVRKDGSCFDAAVVVSATRSAAGELIGFLKLMVDISARKRVETARELQLASALAARLEAERVGRMKDEFLATLSHEIRTPLNAILGWTQILKSSTADADDIAQGLDVIERNARAQAQIIDDLLDMSRIINGKTQLNMRPVELAAVVHAAIDTLTLTAEAKGVRIVADYGSLEKALVNGDPNRLQQVYWNILSNAIKFTPAGGQITVSLRQTDDAYEVRMTDTGEGIDAHFLPHVFDRFRQADASTTRRHGGLGIGLSIVKQLCEYHGGSVAVTSSGPHQGTTFTVRLPLPRALPETGGNVATATTPAVEHRSPGQIAGPDLTGLRVLVVDDEADARALMQRVLEGCHAWVTTAGSAAAGLAALENARFDLLVSDIGMPGEDGYSLIRRVRLLPQGGDLPAMAVSAYARAEDRKHSAAAGFQAHVAKPIDQVDFFKTLAHVCGRS